MITFVTALYCEALPIIKLFGLKKDTAISNFEVFKSTDITLIITKRSGVHAAVALTLISAGETVRESDILINIGVCGCNDKAIERGTAYLVHKIIDSATGYSYYPDILFRHPFQEGTITTYPLVQKNMPIYTADNQSLILADMEASYIYQAGSYFYQTGQMFFIKIVSDYMDDKNITSEEISCLIADKLLFIKDWIFGIKDLVSFSTLEFTPEELDCYNDIVSQLQLTATMAYELKQLLNFYKHKNFHAYEKSRKHKKSHSYEMGSFLPVVNEFKAEITFPVKVKLEGKKYFEQLKKKLI